MDCNLTTAIETFIKESAARAEGREYFRTPLVAFSSADDPLYDQIVKIVGPPHQRPKDFLPSAKTVISFFIPFQKMIVQANKGDGPVSELWVRSYLAANALINHINMSLGEFLISRGADSGSVPATHTYDQEALKAGWSHRSAAFVAGLGRFGLNRMLITRLGGAGRYGTVFTSAELPVSERSEEERCLYYQNGSCQACIKACPVSALTTDDFDRFKCNENILANLEYLSERGTAADVCGKCVVAGPCAFKEIEP
ncbi:MAG: epoxyqueuosine reductase [Deltaproteobacteria bacterium]|nr:epoxyqueuosine reductase [Deltaproteobacteria bacterium]